MREHGRVPGRQCGRPHQETVPFVAVCGAPALPRHVHPVPDAVQHALTAQPREVVRQHASFSQRIGGEQPAKTQTNDSGEAEDRVEIG